MVTFVRLQQRKGDKVLVKSISIAGFRQLFNVATNFHQDVNYIIGHNGTGKTTFARLIVAALTGDARSLTLHAFDRIEVQFTEKGRTDRAASIVYERKSGVSAPADDSSFTATLRVNDKIIAQTDSMLLDPRMISRYFHESEYIVEARQLYFEPVLGSVVPERVSRRRTASGQERIVQARLIRDFLKQEVRVKWLPIERVTRSEEPAKPSANGEDSNSVNRKVVEVQNALVRYFSELERQKSAELETFRNNCLLALFDVEASTSNRKIAVNRVSAIERELNELIPELRLSPELETRFRNSSQSLLDWLRQRQGRPIEALRQALARLEDVLGFWKETQAKLSEVFRKRDELLDALRDSFALMDLPLQHRAKFAKTPELLSNNEIVFKSSGAMHDRALKLMDLSSGEKQFFIMLAEVLLERDAQEILIIDEPELSLHVTWQNRLVGDLRRLNPNVQLILATHSPDIISEKNHLLVRMEEAVSPRS